MAYSYLSNAVKTQLSDEFNNLHATFGRPITIWRTAHNVVISTSPDQSYIFAGSPENSQIAPIQQSGVFLARILYGKKQTLDLFNSSSRFNSADQNNLFMQEGEMRIKLDPTGAAYLDGAKSVTVDGAVFEIVTSKRPHSLIGTPNFFDFFLRKEN